MEGLAGLDRWYEIMICLVVKLGGGRWDRLAGWGEGWDGGFIYHGWLRGQVG